MLTPNEHARLLDSLKTNRDRIDGVHERLDNSSRRMELFEAEMRSNTAATLEVRDILQAARVGLKVLGGIGVAAKWLGTIAAAAFAIWTFVYALMHNGASPK